MQTNPRIVIIGSGPTGLGAAWRLVELGWNNWDLVERDNTVGGLASSSLDDRGFTWDLGGHVLFSHYEYFDRLMDLLLGDRWVEHTRESWVWIKNRFIPYPLQNNIHSLPVFDFLSCLLGLARIRKTRLQAPANFRDWILGMFGQRLSELFMLPYNRKVWAYDPSELDTGWMGERVAKPDPKRLLKNWVLREFDTSWGPNARFRFPLRGGTGAIWRALFDRLPKERIQLTRDVTRIRTRNRSIVFSDGTSTAYDFLISTMPLDTLLRSLEDREDLGAYASKFKHSSTHVVGVGMAGMVPEHLKTKCWMYFSQENIPFYRATVFSNYSPFNVPQPGRQWSIMCEKSQSPDAGLTRDSVIQDMIGGLRVARLLPADAEIVTQWYAHLEYGYPTPFLGRDTVLEAVDPELRKLGIWSRGRFGAWKYEVSNQDHSFMQGLEAIDHILFGDEEVTYTRPSVVNGGKQPIGGVTERRFFVTDV